jgi:hypothetical protein
LREGLRDDEEALKMADSAVAVGIEGEAKGAIGDFLV